MISLEYESLYSSTYLPGFTISFLLASSNSMESNVFSTVRKNSVCEVK